MLYPSNNQACRKIVIEGPIGSGKTTLAKKIAFKMGADALFEPVEDNPFIDDFYKSEDKKAFATQLYFLLHRDQQLQDWLNLPEEQRNNCLVMDYLPEKHHVFAKTTLNRAEQDLYQQLLQRLVLTGFKPDLVIYLQVSDEQQWQRIQRRGLSFDLPIQQDFLTKLSDAYADFFHHYDASPVLVVNTDGINIADNEQDFEMLMQYIQKIRSGRHFFNPMGSQELP